ncbi:MAG: hypothetical protein R3220_09430 [Balneolaceae bacterium]|nr:hypothetical protein [Balneolaceae bacterium]
MNRPTEKHIEQYVRYPSQLSREEKAWIEEWIDKDNEIHLLVKWFKEYYAEVNKVESRKNKPKSVPPVIQLKPFEKKSKISNGFILAAQTPVSGKKRSALKTVKTFVSNEHKTLIRILHDDHEKQTKFFVISEFVDDDDIVLMNVSEEQSFFVSRPGGTFIVSDQRISEKKIMDWSTCRLHLPLAKMDVFRTPETGELNIDSTGINREKYEISFEVVEEQLHIVTDFGADIIPEKLIVYSNEDSTFRTINNGKCSISLTDLKNPHSVLFFYN